jgi:hypothetical protein
MAASLLPPRPTAARRRSPAPASRAPPLHEHEHRRHRGLPAGWLPRRCPRRPPEMEETLQLFLFLLNFGDILIQHFLKNTEMLIQHFYNLLKVYLSEKCWVNIFKSI